MAAAAVVVSGATDRLTEVPGWLVPTRLRVNPGAAPVTVFVGLEILIPFTVSKALLPDTADANPKPVALEVTVKLPLLPEVLLAIAILEPDASIMILAVSPRPDPVIAVCRSASVLTPLPVVMVADLPALFVIVKLSTGSAMEAFATVVEANDAVVARLLTATTLFPVVLPKAAVAVTTPVFEDDTVVAANGPVRLLSATISLSRLVTLA